jgi:cell division protein FtsQ
MAKPTTRTQQSKRISRRRAQRKKRETFGRRLQIFFSIAAIFSLTALGYWAWDSGEILRMHRGFWQQTAHAGFRLDHVYLSGHEHITRDQVMNSIIFDHGDPILQLSLDEIKDNLEAMPRVLRAEVSRSLPASLHIRIIERQAVALWQHDGRMVPVDSEGKILGADIKGNPQNMPIIVGKKAHEHIKPLLEMLASAPALLARLDAAIWVNDRRWDIVLKNDIRIKLPEQRAPMAWRKLSDLQGEHALLDQPIAQIDMRLPDRLFVTPHITEQPGASST